MLDAGRGPSARPFRRRPMHAAFDETTTGDGPVRGACAGTVAVGERFPREAVTAR